MKKVKGNEKYKLLVIQQTSHGGVMHSTKNTVSNSAITVCGDRWSLDFSW